MPDLTAVFVDLGNATVEFMEPHGEDFSTAAFLRKNPDGGMHHAC